jgi:hypothetical protein
MLEFQYGSSIVIVCSHCGSAVARTDRDLESLGTVAAIIDTGSPLRIGLDGRYLGVTFRISGRVQLRHAMGGFWDEWYAAFGDGRWGWLAEAQGQFYLTFQTAMHDVAPRFEDVEPGQRLTGALADFTADEKGVAAAISAEGEIPWRVIPNESYEYVDVTALDARFATIDYSEAQPLLFAGRRVSLEELAIAEDALGRTTKVHAQALGCPKCGGPLELRMPDRAERVTCPHCGSLLDATAGKLRFFSALRQDITPRVPLGTKGTVDGIEWTVVGYLQRSTVVDAERYFWDEYLLYEPRHGFRWLVNSDDHWSWVQPLTAGEVRDEDKRLVYQNKTFRIFQRSTARVQHVIGEFYWKVEFGEVARASDYVAPPLMISREEARSAQSQEVAYSLGRYMTVAEVQKTFGLKDLPKPRTIGPNQPNPYALGTLFRDFVLFAFAAVIISIVLFIHADRRVLLDRELPLEALAAGEQSKVIFTDKFDISANRNLEIEARAAIDNSWLNVDADLVNEKSSATEQFSIPVEYYHGYEDGENWSEGTNDSTVYLAAVPPGSYSMRLDVQWEKPDAPPARSLHVRVREGVPRGLHFLIALIALSLLPLWGVIRRAGFETRRWNDSTFTSGGTKKSDMAEDDE